MWYIICDNCETGDSGKVAHSNESGDVREYGDSDKTCDSGESDISSEYGESVNQVNLANFAISG